MFGAQSVDSEMFSLLLWRNKGTEKFCYIILNAFFCFVVLQIIRKAIQLCSSLLCMSVTIKKLLMKETFEKLSMLSQIMALVFLSVSYIDIHHLRWINFWNITLRYYTDLAEKIFSFNLATWNKYPIRKYGRAEYDCV